MMKKEFEALAGYEVTWEDYTQIIEPMYMATNLSKSEFVKVIDRSRFALRTEKELVAALRKEARHLKEICGHRSDSESENRYMDTVWELERRFGGAWVTIYAYEYGDRGCRYPEKIAKYDFDREVKTYKLVA